MPLEAERQEQLSDLSQKIGTDFGDLILLHQAFLHTSYLNERDIPYTEGNERLEFLGDAVLGLIVTEELYRRFGDRREGDLSKVKSIVVSRNVLAEKAEQLKLGAYILLGKGEELTGGRTRKSILANTLESLIGAIYLSGGLYLTRQFVLRYFGDEIQNVSMGRGIRDYKSELQEYLQRESRQLPQYRVLKILGPDHDKIYIVDVQQNGKVLGSGEGKSKKEAEQLSARRALRCLLRQGS